MAVFRFILALRPVNLLMTLFIMLSVRMRVFGMAIRGHEPAFAGYLLYAVSVLAAMAFGYLVNDYFDVETDKINKPGKNIFENHPPLWGTAYMVSFALAAVVLPYCEFVTGHLPYACVWINAAALVLLYAYARNGKSTVLWGNLLIAGLTLLLFLGIYLACGLYGRGTDRPGITLFRVYAFFSFVLTLAREIVKDAEDTEGDLRSGIITLATRRGVHASRHWALAAVWPIPLLLAGVSLYLFNEGQFIRAVAFAVLAVYGIFTLFILWQSHDKAGFKRTSLALKIYMILGITSMWL